MSVPPPPLVSPANATPLYDGRVDAPHPPKPEAPAPADPSPYRGNATPGGDAFPRLIWGGFAAVLACLVLRGAGSGGVVDADEADFVRTLIEVKDRVEGGYVSDVDADDLRLAAINGMLALTTDPNTNFIPPQQTEAFDDRLEGTFRGIGVTVSLAPGGGMLVERPLPGGPAIAAGVRGGDVIVEADGVDLTDKPLSEATELVRGPIGTSVQLAIARPGHDGRLELEVRRDTVAAPIVDGFTTDPVTGEPGFLVEPPEIAGVGTGEGPRVAYVRLREFAPTAAASVLNAIREVDDGGPVDALILDLRDNPGGLLDEAWQLADLFLPAGKLITWEGGKTVVRAPLVATAPADELGQRLEAIPLVLLVDAGSASASEVVSGALSDHGRATIVGEATYGKGSVQSVYELGSRGRLGRLKLTRAYYHLPGGRVLERTADGRAFGVGVDVPVPLVEGDARRDPDADGPDFPRQVWRAYEVVLGLLAVEQVDPDEPVDPLDASTTRPA